MNYSDSSNSVVEICLISPDFEDFPNSSLRNTVLQARIAFAVMNGLCAPPTFFINLLIIWTLLGNSNLRSSSYNILLVCLAFTDILVGIITEPFIVWHLGCLAMNCKIRCLYTIVFIPVFIYITWILSSLMVVSVERYLAIKHPVLHRTKVTSKRMIIAIAIVWITTPTFLLVTRHALTLSNIGLKAIPALVNGVVQVVVIAYCTITVQVIAHRRRRAFRIRVFDTRGPNAGGNNQDQTERRCLKEFKCAFTTSILVIATFVCYCPSIAVIIIETAKTGDVSQDFLHISDTFIITFVNLQSLVNPLIVSLRIGAIRKSVKKKLCCYVPSQSNLRTIENVPVSLELQKMPRPAPTQQKQN